MARLDGVAPAEVCDVSMTDPNLVKWLRLVGFLNAMRRLPCVDSAFTPPRIRALYAESYRKGQPNPDLWNLATIRLYDLISTPDFADGFEIIYPAAFPLLTILFDPELHVTQQWTHLLHSSYENQWTSWIFPLEFFNFLCSLDVRRTGMGENWKHQTSEHLIQEPVEYLGPISQLNMHSKKLVKTKQLCDGSFLSVFWCDRRA